MKTSNKFLMAALALLLGSLTFFNLSLRAEYRRGTYKDPLRNTTALNFKNFDEINVPAASALRVKIVAGSYGVRVSDKATDFVKVSQQGGRLSVTLTFPDERHYFGFGGDVVTISCPQLKRLTVSGTYSVAGKPATDPTSRGGAVRVQGFRQDSLTLRQDQGTRLELAANQLGYLRAEAGASAGSHSVLRIEADNRVQTADLRMQSQSELQLEGRIELPRYQFGDSARATLSGAALAGLARK